ncbi:amino acid permease [Hydrotalea sp.]|uniref:APC family permease n=1 Tax=Hydrotalea sp. TaxID=2881279 RepID=UPI00258A5DEC|nr:amino acid permease [Hydrotalea sp.]
MAKLQRTLRFRTTVAIVVGGVIGSGIFMKPALMAGQLGAPWLLLSVWVVAGLITLFGALSNAEVAAMFPETGGQYIFFQKMYGNAFAFVYGWAAFAVFNTAGNASIAYVFAQYTNYFIALPQCSAATVQAVHVTIPLVGTIYPLNHIGVKLLTIALVLVLTWVNYRSVRQGGAIQRVLTALKSVAIVLLIGGILFSGKGHWHHLQEHLPGAPTGWALVGAYMAALAGAFWAYDGWNNITFVAGEIQQPQRNIPKSLLIGLFFCMVVYELVHLAYLYVLPIHRLALSAFVASDAATVVWGTWGGSIIALMVIFSIISTTNANVLATARVTYAMGTENRWFAWAGKMQPKYHTPGNALITNAVWTVMLILSGSFDMLTDMLIFVSWFFYGMSALGVFILRSKMKDTPRPYRVFGYPFVPLLFVAFVTFFLSATLYTDIMQYRSGQAPIINSFLGILITAVGIPVYFFSKKKGK